MDNINTLIEWQPYQLMNAALLVIIVNISLGFSLWKSLSDSEWARFFDISSILTIAGAVSLAITMTRVKVVDSLVNISTLLLAFGIVLTIFGAICDVAHRISLYRDTHYNKEA
ncbi:hypothetical protein H3S83_03795 [Bartonella sp. W8122]|uniref:hypothetical protein n=1 Tax=Bartonella sp. W8122 TaxID=2750930 RepID=UPI0018DC9318|nr:hypothetical protein [Bartonella sp. W8122]MBI0000951.1 hypothetical protein [Bartonella sp. W8122]